MQGSVAVVSVCMLAGAVACSGATTGSSRPGGDEGGASGSTQVGGAMPSRAGSDALGGSDSNPGSSGEGGALQGGASTGGTVGTAAADSGGTANAGSSGAAPLGVASGFPPEGAAWEVPTGDPLNSTPPVLAPLGTGVVLAGASADPKTVGVDAFGTGVKSEAFLAGLDHSGKALWRRPLLAAGLPSAVAVSTTQEIVVVAAYLPDLETVSPFLYSDSIFLGRFAANGAPIFEKELKFDIGTRAYALALAADGSVWIAGAQTSTFPNESLMLAKYDAGGTEQFFKLFPCDGSTCYVTSLSITPTGDVVLCGTFNASFDLGGGKLATEAKLNDYGMPNGFAARFDETGKHVWSQRFGGPIYDLCNAISALPDGDIALAGLASGAASIGGKSVTAEESVGQAFVTRLDPTGQARWLELVPGSARALALEVDGDTLHVAGNFDRNSYVQRHSLATGKVLDWTKTYVGSAYATTSALDSLGSLWLAGTYDDPITLNGADQLSAASGVFLLRLDRRP